MARPEPGVVTRDPGVDEHQLVVGERPIVSERAVDPDLALAAVAADLPEDGRRGADRRDREDHRPVVVGGGPSGPRWPVSNGGHDLDVAGRDRGSDDELDRGPRRRACSRAPGRRRARRRRGRRRPRRGGRPKRLEVGRVEVDRVPVGDADPVAARPPLALHRPLDPALDLDRLETGPEEAGRRALEEALEEALEPGERSHGRAGV